MSEDVRNNTEPVQPDKKIEEFKLDISGSSFDPIVDSKFMFARDFGELISNIFRNIFVDWEGCTISDIKGTSFIGVDFFFNHNEYPEDGTRVRAISRETDTKTKNSTLSGIRRFNNMINNGDRYYLTDVAQKCFTPFLYDNIGGLYGQHGKVNWNRAVSEVAEANQKTFQMYGQIPTQQYTKLSFIDPSKIATAIYGEEDEDGGAKWCYQVTPVFSMPIMSQYGVTNNTDPASRILRIDRVSATELNNLATKLGFSNIGNRLNIIR
jgi:hypothetical protein